MASAADQQAWYVFRLAPNSHGCHSLEETGHHGHEQRDTNASTPLPSTVFANNFQSIQMLSIDHVFGGKPPCGKPQEGPDVVPSRRTFRRIRGWGRRIRTFTNWSRANRATVTPSPTIPQLVYHNHPGLMQNENEISFIALNIHL